MAELNIPHNPEAEQSVLGSIIIERTAGSMAIEKLRETDFYIENHRLIFNAAKHLYSINQNIDLVTLVGELRRRQHLDQIGGLTYLNNLADIVPTTANLNLYINELLDKAILRAMITSSRKISNMALAAQEPALDILNKAELEFSNLNNLRGGEAYSSLGSILENTLEEISQLADNRSQITGISTGFRDLDFHTSGLQKSDLIIVAARPGMGKTAFMTNIITSAAVRHDVPVAFFSLEMSKSQLAQRILSFESQIELADLRNGHLTEAQWSYMTDKIDILSKKAIYIDDTPALSISEFRARLRRMKTQLNIGLAVVDYLQLMTLDSRSESRQQEISFLSRALKAIAKELDMPIIAASQLNRGVENRADKRPILSDLLESGGIEANADMVIFLYRDDYYDDKSSKKNIAEVIIAKHRNGPTTTVELAFRGKYTQFANLAKDPNKSQK